MGDSGSGYTEPILDHTAAPTIDGLSSNRVVSWDDLINNVNGLFFFLETGTGSRSALCDV